MMSIIEKLEHTVTPALLGNIDNVAYVSLLEEFYAIVVSRLAIPQIYSQLLRSTDQENHVTRVAGAPLFEQLWPDVEARHLIINELVATHHANESTVTPLLINAVPLIYHELRTLANGQFLPAYLQGEQQALRHYLPIWSAAVIAAPEATNEFIDPYSLPINASTSPIIAQSDIAASSETGVILTKQADSLLNDNDGYANTDAIHANPSAHFSAENPTHNRRQTRAHNQRNNLLVWLLFMTTVVAIIGLVWALVIRPGQVAPVVPIANAPEPVAVEKEPTLPAMIPAQLIVGVDNSGSLYTCKAIVGDVTLQTAIQQALNTSFGEQASICELTIKEGVASTIPNLATDALPNMMTLLRSVPFARLQLQNDRMTLEAPDSMMLQGLLMNMRTLLPAMMIDSTAQIPLPMPNNNANDLNNNMAAMPGANNQFDNNNPGMNNGYNDNLNGSSDYQPMDDDTGDMIVPAPDRNAIRNNNGVISNTPSGPISLSEVDEMASSEFVVEPAQVNRLAN